jgi:acetyl esterase/lipase
VSTSPFVDPEVAAMAATMPIEPVSAETLARARIGVLQGFPPLSGGVQRQQYQVPGDHDLVVHVHRPVDLAGAAPCLYFMHGGGYVLGAAAMDDARFDAWCPLFGCVGVSVDYRLSPETPYPGPLEDCYAGLRWVFENHGELGIDPARIGIGGSSAGAGLAAALALLARDRGEHRPAFQLLDAPMLDDRQQTPSSRSDGLVIWSRESNAFGWRAYLGEIHGSERVPPHAAPARAADLSGLPPAYVCVGTADGFRDEDVAYALRLNQAGVPTDLHVHAGVPHGVMRFPDLPAARRYRAGIEDWLGRALRDARGG